MCECEATASQSYKMWTEFSYSVPHFLQMALLLSPFMGVSESCVKLCVCVCEC